MDSAITLGLIMAAVFTAAYLLDKYGKTKAISPEDMKSVRSAAFLNAYLNDDCSTYIPNGQTLENSNNFQAQVKALG